MPYATPPPVRTHPSERERERVNADVSSGSERRQVRRLLVLNLLLVLTVAFLIKVVFDFARDLEHPPKSGDVFYITKQE